MRVQWKRVAMIMLVGLLVMGPLAQIQNAGAQSESSGEKFLKAAQASNDKASKDFQTMMTKMDSMKKMPMTANEKEMMTMMGQMADTMKMLIDANKSLIDAVREYSKMKQ